jgi:capsular exopolysaccharide synthesis family protein
MHPEPALMEQATPPQPITQSRDNQLRFIVNVGARHWRMIAIFTLIASVVTGAWGYMRSETIRPGFKAQVGVIVKRSLWEKDILRGVGGTTLAPLTPEGVVKGASKENLAREVTRALVQADLADGGGLSRVSTDEEMAAKAADIGGRINLSADSDSGVINIEVINCASLQEAERIAEFTARVFVEMNRRDYIEERQKTYEAVKQRMVELQKELYSAESAEWEFKKNMGFRTYGKVGDDMMSMWDELKEKQALKTETEAKLGEIEASLKANSEQLPQALGNVTDTVVTDLLTELDTLLQDQVTMSVTFTPEYEGMKEVQEQIDEKRQAILEAVKRLDASVGGGTSIWQQRQELYRQQMDLRMQLTGLQIRTQALHKIIEETIPQIPELANKNLEFERLNQEVKNIRLQFDDLRKREFDIRSALARDSGAIERHTPVMAMAMSAGLGGMRWWINFVIGAMVGFLVGFGLAVMLDMMDTSIRSIEDVAEYIGIEVIGTIPQMRFGKPKGGGRRRGVYVADVDEEQIDACIVTQHDPKSPISEAYRTLRTNFQFATMKQHPQTVMFTSAVPGEGKTTTAVNFAVTMADRGIRVLLVDTDLRRPNVHRVLKMERGTGLADVLREGLDVASVIRPTRVQNLFIISSGRVPPNPSELIGSERMQKLMKQLGAEFDLVICDAPSILVVTDPVLLATHVDTAIMVISVNNARRETIQRAVKLIQTAHANFAGVVLNGLEATRRHYYYYYYYYDESSNQGKRRWYHF